MYHPGRQQLRERHFAKLWMQRRKAQVFGLRFIPTTLEYCRGELEKGAVISRLGPGFWKCDVR